MSADWEELKDLGNAAFKSRQFTTALEHFSKAIELNPESHVLLSNRSGAYASLGKWREARADAERCIELKPDWPKAYSRKGAALEGLEDFQGAKAAYQAGLQYEPTNASLQAALESVSNRPVPGASGMGPGSVPAAVPISDKELFLNMGTLIGLVLYMLPLLGTRVAFYSYRASVGCCVIKYGMSLLTRHGLSRQTLSNINGVMADDNAHYLLLSLILLVWRPVPFVLIPMGTYAFGSSCPALLQRVNTTMPERVKAVLTPRLSQACSQEGQMYIAAFGSTTEVMLGIALVLSLVSGIRNFAIVFFYWRFLTWRYKASEWTRRGVWALQMQGDKLCHHRYAPKIIGLGYEKLKQLIKAQYNASQARAQ